MTKRRRLILPVLASVGLIAAGCGGSESLTGTSGDTTGTDTTLTDTTGTDTTFTDTTGTDTTFTDTTGTDTTFTDTTETDTTETDTTFTDTTATSGDRFVDPNGKFSIEVPSGWTSAQESPKAWYINDDRDRFRENVNILTETLPTSDYGLEKYVDLSISKAPSLIRQFNVEKREKVTLASGDEAFRIIYTGRPTGAPAELDFKFLALITTKGTTAATLTMTAPPDEFDGTLDANWDAFSTLQAQ